MGVVANVRACTLSCSTPIRDASAFSLQSGVPRSSIAAFPEAAFCRRAKLAPRSTLREASEKRARTFHLNSRLSLPTKFNQSPLEYSTAERHAKRAKGIRAATNEPDTPEKQASAAKNEEQARAAKNARSRVHAGCPCCGRRAALLGGSLGLALPKQGLAQELPGTPVSSSQGPLRRWYEEFFAFVMAKTGAVYEPKIQPYKDAVLQQLQNELAAERRTEGTLQVVEIGVGPAPNLHYWAAWPGPVHVTGVDHNSSMEPYAQENARQPGLDRLAFDFALGSATNLPIPSGSVDAVVSTLVLCSVNDVARSLAEVRRVLRPGGKFLFIEHVAAPDGTNLRRFQEFLNPLQHALADGCNLNRDTLQAVQNAPFSSVDASSVSIDGLSLLSPHVIGIATA